MSQLWCFSAVDSLFFRESRPMESIGNAELQSRFPPPIRTMIGAIRTCLGEATDIDWSEYQKDKNHPMRKIMGGDEPLNGPLEYRGPFVSSNSERLYPVPLNLQGQLNMLEMMQPGAPVECDLGKRVRLLRGLPSKTKPLSVRDYWIREKDFQCLLEGILPPIDSLVAEHKAVSTFDSVSSLAKQKEYLYTSEPRVGIARNNQTRTVEVGRLFQTQHLRMSEGVSLDLEVSGLDAGEITNRWMSRLGGEGRLASINVIDKPPRMKAPTAESDAIGIILYLLTDAYLSAEPASGAWSPLPGFKREEKEGSTVWIGALGGIELCLHSAITGKPVREGGWSLQKRQPRALKSLTPAGSCWYCTVENTSLQQAINELHDYHIGEETILGRGLLAVGLWSSLHKEQ